MNWRSIDWIWIWIVAVCCCLLGALQAYEKAVLQEVPQRAYQPFLVLLEPDITPEEKLQLRGSLSALPGVTQIKWLTPQEVIARVVRYQGLSEEQIALIQNEIPVVVELEVPSEVLLQGQFDPNFLYTLPGVDRYHWDESFITSIHDENARWQARCQQMRLGLMIASVILIAVSFLLASHRNQLRLACEQAGVSQVLPTSELTASKVYLGGFGHWLQVMVGQAVGATCLALGLFVTFSRLLTWVDTSPPVTLQSMTDWQFLWVAGVLAFLGKGLDLVRVRLRYEQARRGR